MTFKRRMTVPAIVTPEMVEQGPLGALPSSPPRLIGQPNIPKIPCLDFESLFEFPSLSLSLITLTPSVQSGAYNPSGMDKRLNDMPQDREPKTGYNPPSLISPTPASTSSSMTEASGPQDDWTSVQERAERRKIQNRLNVRAHRKRKALETGRLMENLLAPRRRNPRVGCASQSPNTDADQLDARSSEDDRIQNQKTRLAILSHLRANKSLDELKILFPMSKDHLIPLIQFNALRAVYTNIHLLHQLNMFCPPHSSLHNKNFTPILQQFTANSLQIQGPDTLQPTLLQRTVPHHFWIDTLPLPRMRDNAILAGDSIDLIDFQSDCFGALSPKAKGRDNPGDNGVLAWSDPWHPRGWELTEGFARKWKILLEGCDEILESTNYWRSLRDEEPLRWEAI